MQVVEKSPLEVAGEIARGDIVYHPQIGYALAALMAREPELFLSA